MNRRAFLSTIAAGLAAAADPERLLWEPGRKLISIPKPPRILLEAGDIFTIAGCYAVNPVTRQVAVWRDAIGREHRFLQHFVVTARVTDRTPRADIAIWPYPGRQVDMSSIKPLKVGGPPLAVFSTPIHLSDS